MSLLAHSKRTVLGLVQTGTGKIHSSCLEHPDFHIDHSLFSVLPIVKPPLKLHVPIHHLSPLSSLSPLAKKAATQQHGQSSNLNPNLHIYLHPDLRRCSHPPTLADPPMRAQPASPSPLDPHRRTNHPLPCQHDHGAVSREVSQHSDSLLLHASETTTVDSLDERRRSCESSGRQETGSQEREERKSRLSRWRVVSLGREKRCCRVDSRQIHFSNTPYERRAED